MKINSLSVLLLTTMVCMYCTEPGSLNSDVLENSSSQMDDEESSYEGEVSSVSSEDESMDSYSSEDALDCSDSESSSGVKDMSSSELVSSGEFSSSSEVVSSSEVTQSSVVSSSESSMEESSSSYPPQEDYLIQAEDYDDASGVAVFDEGYVGNVSPGDWIMFSAIDFGEQGYRSMKITSALYMDLGQAIADETWFEIRIDGEDGSVIGTFEPDNTRGWGSFTEQSVNIQKTTGVHDLYFIAKDLGRSQGGGNIDNITLSADTVPDVVKVLFVGNSYTFYYNMPEIVETMATSQGAQLMVERSNKPGAWWDFHTDQSEASTLELIATGKYDYVILQNNSKSAYDPDRFLTHGKILIDSIKSSGAEPLLYMTWGRQDYNDPNGILQDTISAMYRKLAEQEGIEVVPVGEMWQQLRDDDPSLGDVLFDSDGSHPSETGSYFIAMIFYHYLTGLPVVDLSNSLEGISVDVGHFEALQPYAEPKVSGM